MSTLIKDLGAVSAYAYAVEKGYTGTEDEFASLMYDYTDVIQIASEARDGAVAANASAQEAKAEAQTASNTANEAANKATSKASEASASVTEAGKATNAAVAAKTAAETAQQRAETAQQASEDAQRKAEIAKNEAQENATIANNKASKASQYATTATNKASEASTSAKNAKTYSEQSQASATTANTKADEASASANSARVSADNAQQSATNAQTYMNSSSTSANKAQANAEKTQSDKEAVESAKSDVLSAVDNAQNYANSAQSASQAIQNMNVEATTLEPDSDATVEKTVDAVSGAVTLTYGIPKGQVGEKGDKGDTGDSGVYIGTSAPSDENVNVWIDSDGEPDDVIQIDDTLTQSGQAADAKKTGDEITSLKSGLTQVNDGNVALFLVPNEYVEVDGQITPYNNWGRTDYIPVTDTVKVYTDYNSNYCGFYDASKTFVQIAQIRIGWNELQVPPTAEYLIVSNRMERMQSVKIESVTSIKIQRLTANFESLEQSINEENGYIIKPNGTNDMKSAIETALETYGRVQLLAGEYYVTGIEMPVDSEIFGIGEETNIILLSIVTDGACIIPSRNNSIRDISFKQMKGNNIKPGTATVGTIDGIRVLNEASLCRIENCNFYGFKRAGVYGNTVGHSSYQSIIIENCRFMYCEIGVYFDYFAEYAVVSNSYCSQSYNGVRNDAGNNLFVGCHFDGNNSAFTMMTYNISGTNDGHGSCVGCTFNHSDNYAVYVRGGSHGFVFVGCHFYYGAIYLRSCTGIVFDSCQSDGTEGIIFNAGKGHRFVNMSFVATPAITVESGTPQNIRFINCYLLDGSAEVTYQSA